MAYTIKQTAIHSNQTPYTSRQRVIIITHKYITYLFRVGFTIQQHQQKHELFVGFPVSGAYINVV